ncbi:hypothetical protein HN51_068469, partial [Arachis hypogaea]
MPDHYSSGGATMNDQLSNPTSIFGLRLWVVLGVCVGASIVLLLFLISICLASKRSKKTTTITTTTTTTTTSSSIPVPDVSKEIQEIRVLDPNPLPDPIPEPEPDEENPSVVYNRIQFEIGKNHRISYPTEQRPFLRSSSREGSGEVSHLGWGHWYTLRELEDSTNGFAPENVIGEGGYGIVYHGVLKDNTNVAVKNLLNN